MSRRPKSGSAAFCCTGAWRPRRCCRSQGSRICSRRSSTRWRPSLAPLRRRALEVALLLAEPGKEAPDPRAIGLALLDVLQMLAERQPVVLALDDLQWLDPSSAGVLQIALRRLRDERVGLLATVRTAPDTTVPVELDRAFTADRLARLPIGPLSMGALHHLLRERVGLDLTRPELVRVQEASAGNPFFALELGRELVRTGSRPTTGQGPAGAREPVRAPREAVSPGFRPIPATSSSSQRRSPARRSSSWSRHTGTVRPSSRRSTPPRGREWSSSTTRVSASPIPCSRRSATSRLRSGSAVRFTERSRGRSPTSRSGRATWRCPWTGRTPSPPRTSTRPPSRRPLAGRRRRQPSSPSSQPT